jgi:hypothetical protein
MGYPVPWDSKARERYRALLDAASWTGFDVRATGKEVRAIGTDL